MTVQGTQTPPRVTTESRADGIMVRVTGRIDVHTSTDIRLRLHEIIDERDGLLLLDLGDAIVGDATGLGLLLECHRRGRRLGRDIRLVAADERCERLLRRLSISRQPAYR